MRIYKVTIERIMYVEANTKGEAEEMAYDEDFITEESQIVNIERSSKAKAITEFLRTDNDE